MRDDWTGVVDWCSIERWGVCDRLTHWHFWPRRLHGQSWLHWQLSGVSAFPAGANSRQMEKSPNSSGTRPKTNLRFIVVPFPQTNNFTALIANRTTRFTLLKRRSDCKTLRSRRSQRERSDTELALAALRESGNRDRLTGLCDAICDWKNGYLLATGFNERQ